MDPRGPEKGRAPAMHGDGSRGAEAGAAKLRPSGDGAGCLWAKPDQAAVFPGRKGAELSSHASLNSYKKMVAMSGHRNARRQFTPSLGLLAHITLGVQSMTSSSFINPEVDAQDH